MKTYLHFSMCLLLLGASAAWAGEAGKIHPNGETLRQKIEERLQAMDKNGDGNISKEEFMTQAEARFSKLDANGDGQISKEESEGLFKKRKDSKDKAELESFP